MNLCVKIFFTCLLLAVVHAKGQNNWMDMVYNPDVKGIEENPMKGLMPGYKGINSTFPYSTDHFYIPLKDVYKGWGNCDWSKCETEINRIVSGGRHVVLRFWLNYPNRESGIPDFLLPYLNLYSDQTPDWNDEDLMRAFEEFIALFGKKYDGDTRIALIEAGLYGKWGEWHTYPESERSMTTANKDRILIAYRNAFKTTHIGLRQSNHASTKDLKMSVGYYDDSFCYNTLCLQSWCSWGNILTDGITDNYRYHPFCGELRPELQSVIFDDWPNSQGEDITKCVKTTHLSFLKSFYLYKQQPTATEFTNALKMHKMMGYQFFVRSVLFTSDSTKKLSVNVKIQNRGVAPIYYNWKVQFAAVKNSGEWMGVIDSTDWNIQAILPDSTYHFRTLTMPFPEYNDCRILMRFVNPLESVTSKARPLKFANQLQDFDREGWLTLGSVTETGTKTSVTGIKIDNCPAVSLKKNEVYFFKTSISPADATNQIVSWISSNPNVATVNSKGEVKSIAEGSALIKVTSNDGGFTDSCRINVQKDIISVYGVTLGNCPLFILKTGDSQQLIANVAPVDATDKTVLWRSSNTAVATVDGNGLVKAKSQGSVKITVTSNDGGFSNTCSIGVISSGIPVTEVSIIGCLSDSIKKGENRLLTAEISPANAGDHSVTWKSSNPSVATIDENGKLTAISAGIALITATSASDSKTGNCEVKVTGKTITYAVQTELDSAKIKAYPNPVSSELYLEFPESILEKTITIFTISGKLLMKKFTNNKVFKLNVKEFSAENILIVQVKSANSADYFKILVNK